MELRVALAFLTVAMVSGSAASAQGDMFSGVYQKIDSGTYCSFMSGPGPYKLDADAGGISLSYYVPPHDPSLDLAMGRSGWNISATWRAGDITTPPLAPGYETIRTIGTYTPDGKTYNFIALEDGGLYQFVRVFLTKTGVEIASTFGGNSDQEICLMQK